MQYRFAWTNSNQIDWFPSVNFKIHPADSMQRSKEDFTHELSDYSSATIENAGDCYNILECCDDHLPQPGKAILWLEQALSRCMALVPRRRRYALLEGLRLAHEVGPIV
ncbi:MAG: hypothetical protein JNM27_11385 [Leptospirales bacterium]|nr:hypothetical protein [Leptospirales bacterium]